MQGKKKFKPKLFLNFCLPDVIPDDNFYKVLKKKLDLSFVYKLTKSVYSHTGRPSLDPVVFFKMLLVGYLENCSTDRALERLFQLRLDLLYFIDHDINEAVPDHSTICKTRKRIPTEVFQAVFNNILKKCVEAGLVSGKIQSIDTAYINANASLDRMVEVKLIDRDPDEYLHEVRSQDRDDDEQGDIARKRLEKSQRDLERYTQMRKEKYSELDGGKAHRKNKRRFLSNATHMSKTDPDARIAKKSSKPRMLCYSSAVAVDTDHNVVTHISAEHASKKDSRLLLDITESTFNRLENLGLSPAAILADAGFSSGENYYILKHWKIDAFIPIHGSYKSIRTGFIYDPKKDQYICRNNKTLAFTSIQNRSGYETKAYYSSKSDCDNCSYRNQCVDSRGIKRILHTLYKEEYEEMISKLKSNKGQQSYALRMQTVEPTIGTLQQYYGLRWINVRGKDLANKVMLMAGAALNLKKWVKKTLNRPFFTLHHSDLLPNIMALFSVQLMNYSNSYKPLLIYPVKPVI